MFYTVNSDFQTFLTMSDSKKYVHIMTQYTHIHIYVKL